MQAILVVGSLNADLVVRVSRFPVPGETISGGDLTTIPGGKGANQAVAAARLGVPTAMLGRVGDDQLGQMLLDNLECNKVDASRVLTGQYSTGTAVIIVNEEGQNSIVLSPGANGQVTKSDVEKYESDFKNAKYLLLQLEIPLDVVICAAQTARKNGLKVLLNPAPARELPDELLENIDFIVPNESELSLLTGMPVRGTESAIEAARRLQQKGTFKVIVTLGDKGVLYINQEEVIQEPAFLIETVDTTAAGDAFIGGLASSFASGKELRESLRYACACGALACTKFGAQPSLPSAVDVDIFLAGV